MKRPLIIGNWKSNKSVKETEDWFAGIPAGYPRSSQAKVILCPPFPLLSLCRKLIKQYQLPWELGAQDVSQFDSGRHTGEVSATLLKDFAEYCLIGHSERREQLGETDEALRNKVKQVKAVVIEPIFFLQTDQTPIPQGVRIVVYEPPGSISPAPSDNPEDVEKVAKSIRFNKNVASVLYGGNVVPENIESFLSLPSIDGIIAGGASLDPVAFAKLIAYA